MAGQDTYFIGECVWYVAGALPWVQGGWGNAEDWPGNASRAGFQLTSIPTPGSVVCYGPGHGYGELGHVAIVLQVYPDGTFLVSEMNAVGWDVVDQRVSNMGDVTAFILAPGSRPGAGSAAGLGRGGASLSDVEVAWSWFQSAFNEDIPQLINRLVAARNVLQSIR